MSNNLEKAHTDPTLPDTPRRSGLRGLVVMLCDNGRLATNTERVDYSTGRDMVKKTEIFEWSGISPSTGYSWLKHLPTKEQMKDPEYVDWGCRQPKHRPSCWGKTKDGKRPREGEEGYDENEEERDKRGRTKKQRLEEKTVEAEMWCSDWGSRRPPHRPWLEKNPGRGRKRKEDADSTSLTAAEDITSNERSASPAPASVRGGSQLRTPSPEPESSTTPGYGKTKKAGRRKASPQDISDMIERVSRVGGVGGVDSDDDNDDDGDDSCDVSGEVDGDGVVDVDDDTFEMLVNINGKRVSATVRPPPPGKKHRQIAVFTPADGVTEK